MATGDTKHLTQQFLVGTNKLQVGMDFVLADNTGTNSSLATDWTTAFNPIAAVLSSELANGGVRVADVSGTPQVSLNYQPTGGDWTVGGIATHAVPVSSALVITKYSALRGKTHRGRLYLPGIVQTDQDQGLVDPTFLATLQGLVTTFLGEISSATASGNVYTPAVFSYLGVPPGVNRVPSDIQAIVSLFCTNVMRNQRRRQVGVSRRGRRRAV